MTFGCSSANSSAKGVNWWRRGNTGALIAISPR
ncbi:Uncharacterised protein [Vibrio cholerae]|nr:Uncharacterised protein [Vibrio cholerae]